MSSLEIKVVGIPQSVDEDALHDFFSRFGTLADIRREGGDDVVIAFESAEDLEDALQINEFEDGTKIIVSRLEAAVASESPNDSHTPTTPEASADKPAAAVAVAAAPESHEVVTIEMIEARTGRDALKVRLSGLPPADITAELRATLEKCGEVTDLFYRAGSSFAFAGFPTAAAVLEATKLNGSLIGGHTATVALKKTDADRRAAKAAAPARDLSRRVVVKKVGNATEAQIRELFGACGEICDFYQNRRSDVCFLEFTNKEATAAALEKSGAMLDGHAIAVEQREAQKCFRCNEEGHLASRCPRREVVCRQCGRSGHIAKDCGSAVDRSRRGDRGDRRRGRRSSRSSSYSRDDSRDRRRDRRRSRRDDSEDSRDRRRSRRDRSRSRSRSPARKSRRRDRSRSRTPPRPRN